MCLVSSRTSPPPRFRSCFNCWNFQETIFKTRKAVRKGRIASTRGMRSRRPLQFFNLKFQFQHFSRFSKSSSLIISKREGKLHLLHRSCSLNSVTQKKACFDKAWSFHKAKNFVSTWFWTCLESVSNQLNQITTNKQPSLHNWIRKGMVRLSQIANFEDRISSAQLTDSSGSY